MNSSFDLLAEGFYGYKKSLPEGRPVISIHHTKYPQPSCRRKCFLVFFVCFFTVIMNPPKLIGKVFSAK
jgi:hypothetical protein